MNLSPHVSTPPVSHSNILLPPLIIAGGIVAIVTVLLIGFHFLLKKLRHGEPDTSPEPEKCAGDAGDDVNMVLSSIPVVRYKKNEPSLKQINHSECSVCLSVIEEGEKVRILPSCGHGFHSRCIAAWLRTRLSCPVCRSSVTAPQVCLTMPLAVVEGCDSAAVGAGKREDHCSLPV